MSMTNCLTAQAWRFRGFFVIYSRVLPSVTMFSAWHSGFIGGLDEVSYQFLSVFDRMIPLALMQRSIYGLYIKSAPFFGD